MKTATERVADVQPERPSPFQSSRSPRYFVLAVAALSLMFAKPLFDLFQVARKSDIFSYVLLLPFISAYLAWVGRAAISNIRTAAGLGAIPAAIGAILLLLNWLLASSLETRVSLYTLAFVCFVLAAGFCFLGAAALRALALPFGLLFCMTPLPPPALDALEHFFQHASAFAAATMIKISGVPAIQDGLFFYLPGFSIEVAKECSGIRSTLVLFVTSLVAGHLLLRTVRNRVILAVSIVPLAILRNGFRIFSLSWLSVEVNPNIIDSALHHRGGPIFFALSLIPFTLLLLLLRRTERKIPNAS